MWISLNANRLKVKSLRGQNGFGFSGFYSAEGVALPEDFFFAAFDAAPFGSSRSPYVCRYIQPRLLEATFHLAASSYSFLKSIKKSGPYVKLNHEAPLHLD